MANWTVATEAGEVQRVRDIRDERRREERTKRRNGFIQFTFRAVRRMLVGLAVMATLGAIFYYRYTLQQMASATTGAMTAKIRQMGTNSGLRQAVVSQEKAVEQAAGTAKAAD